MTVYVDCSSSAYTKNVVHRMLADSEDELHRMAAGLGLRLMQYDSLNRWYLLSHRQRFVAIMRNAVRLVGDEANAMVALRQAWGVLPTVEVARAYLTGVQ